MKEYDVVIVGLGPTGGTLANLLALQGHSILILEKENNFYPLPRAVHFDDEVMRVFQTIGITKKFLKFTLINKGTKFVDSKGNVILDWPRPKQVTENGWYPSYRFHQPDLEKQIRNKLKLFKKVYIKQNTQLLKAKNNKNNVEIFYKEAKTGNSFSVKTKYLVGCDGANSTVRSLINTKMQNLGFTQKWAVVDLILKKKKFNLPDRTIQFSNKVRPATYCRNVGRRRRWEFVINNNEKEQTIMSDKYIWNFLKPWINKRDAKLERKTIYTFKSAISKKWSKGRIFVSGDAAHLMPPFMGQGMCAGIRDVSNLAWKISYCLRNSHSNKLLNTYQSERFSNVKEYIKTTMRMGSFINAMSSIKITKNISSNQQGVKSMKSIKPKLGNGLGNSKDKLRGKIFPQFKIKNGKNFDEKFSKNPILITLPKFKNKISKNVNYINSNKVNGLSDYLIEKKTKGIIVRPDRFILGSINPKKSLKTIDLI